MVERISIESGTSSDLARFQAIRVVLADDHALLRESLRDLFATEPDLTVVGEAATGEDAIRVVRHTRPDVVLLDIGMPGLSGIAVARTLRATVPRSRILVVTGLRAVEYAGTMMRLGARGFVDKTIPRNELIDAVRAVHRGETVLDRFAFDAPSHRSDDTLDPLPTPQEIEVLHLVAGGCRNCDIATRLSIRPSTVEFHLRNLFRKFRVASRTALVGAARQSTWLS